MLPILSLNLMPAAAVVNEETMGFHDDAIFPLKPSYGSSGGPRWSTDIRESDAGIETRNARWGQASLMRYSLNIDLQSDERIRTLVNFARARRGAAFGFLFNDWRDNTNHQDGTSDGSGLADRINLGAGDGAQTVFQVYKYYTDDYNYTVARKITRIKSGTLKVWVNGVLQTVITNYNIDESTGRITFVSAPTAGHAVDVAFEFYVPVRFGEDVDTWMESVQSANDASSIPITLDEVRDIGEQSELSPYGSGQRYTDNTPVRVVDYSDGLYHMFDGNNTASLTTVVLWQPTVGVTPNGGPYHILHNSEPNGLGLTIISGSQSIGPLSNGSAYRMYVIDGLWVAMGG